MVPPRLTLVSDNARDRHADAASADDLRALQEEVRAEYGDPEAIVDQFAASARQEKLRRIEALLFASSEPINAAALAKQIDAKDEINALMAALQQHYVGRGVNLIQVAGKWQFRTAEDLSYLLERHRKDERKLSKAALETLAIIAYHQPVTRAEIEEIRGVQTSPGTLDVLMETGWIRPRGRRRAPGRPLTFGTTDDFLQHFALDSLKDLPGLSDLRASGLLTNALPADFKIPSPGEVSALMPDELPLTDEGEDEDDVPELELGIPPDDEDDDNGDNANESDALPADDADDNADPSSAA